ncbi:unnamed protein product [Effrenium voratum]|uniref:Class I SAM-dependent methyltransferase n=1 Tax=Effrenium voratum TaxID=2562239 RepID=A0AA36JAL9_9DINO|nr:unnamed protein product [Effrenium voratum]CAJ1419478.1 unnamed protein product [Effrenium voratum]
MGAKWLHKLALLHGWTFAVGFGDVGCWFATVTYESCCDLRLGPRGAEICWDQIFTFERCCAVDPCYGQPLHSCPQHNEEPSGALIREAQQVAVAHGWQRLSAYISQVQALFEQKDQIGVDFMAATAFLAAERLQGFPGYGQPRNRALVYYELACRKPELMLSKKAMSVCDQPGDARISEQEANRKIALFHMIRSLFGGMYVQARYLFRLALELTGLANLRGGDCRSRGKEAAARLAEVLERHLEQMGLAMQELTHSPVAFAPGMGTPGMVISERMSSPLLVDYWKKLVEGVMDSKDCFDVVYHLIGLVSHVLESAVRLNAHFFAQIYVTELQESPQPVPGSKVIPLPGQRFTFRSVRCCFRYHVLHQLLEEFKQETVTMIEIGVHAAGTSMYLLDRVPSLHWTGIDDYQDYVKGSGDAMFQEASNRVQRFGPRARLLRVPSASAWDTSGALHGIALQSVDLLFVDGDHDYSVTKNDLVSWSRFVRPGGIISGHDIFNPINDGVTDAVEEVLRGRELVVHFATDHFFWWRQP